MRAVLVVLVVFVGIATTGAFAPTAQAHPGYANTCTDGPFLVTAGFGVTSPLSCVTEVHCNSATTCGVLATWRIGAWGHSSSILSTDKGVGVAGMTTTISGGESCFGVNGCTGSYGFDMNDGDTVSMTCASTDATVGLLIQLTCSFSFF